MEQFGLNLDSDEIRQVNPDGWFYCDQEKAWRCELWRENWPPIQFYRRIEGQWLHGFNGPTALNYLVVFHELDRQNLPPDEYEDLFAALRVIEQTALQEMRKD